MKNWIGWKKCKSDSSNLSVINRLYKESYGSEQHFKNQMEENYY